VIITIVTDELDAPPAAPLNYEMSRRGGCARCDRRRSGSTARRTARASGRRMEV